MKKLEFKISGEIRSISLEKIAGGYSAKVGERFYHQVNAKSIEKGHLILDVDGENFKVLLGENGGTYHVSVREEEFLLEKALAHATHQIPIMGEKKGGNIVQAPMPGKVIKILFKEGDFIQTGQTVAIIEAMKMENNIIAHRDAIIKKIMVNVGDQVNLADPILEFLE
ncbi:MAG: biotin/lipoyl-containing protein [Acidobacteriota bacterium]